MIPSIIKYATLGNILLLFCLSCAQEAIQKENLTEKVTITESPVNIPTSITSTNQKLKNFSTLEITSINRIKDIFDKGLKGKSKRTIANLYKDHAQRLRMDLFNKYPITLNYPYNGKFDLSVVEKELPKLNFLSNKCGYQVQSTGDNLYYYCLKDVGSFMNFIEDLGKENSFIAHLHKDYISNKFISKEVKQELFLKSYDNFDFDQPEHQLVYMFYNILINEELLAAKMIK